MEIILDISQVALPHSWRRKFHYSRSHVLPYVFIVSASMWKWEVWHKSFLVCSGGSLLNSSNSKWFLVILAASMIGLLQFTHKLVSSHHQRCRMLMLLTVSLEKVVSLRYVSCQVGDPIVSKCGCFNVNYSFLSCSGDYWIVPGQDFEAMCAKTSMFYVSAECQNLSLSCWIEVMGCWRCYHWRCSTYGCWLLWGTQELSLSFIMINFNI